MTNSETLKISVFEVIVMGAPEKEHEFPVVDSVWTVNNNEDFGFMTMTQDPNYLSLPPTFISTIYSSMPIA